MKKKAPRLSQLLWGLREKYTLVLLIITGFAIALVIYWLTTRMENRMRAESVREGIAWAGELVNSSRGLLLGIYDDNGKFLSNRSMRYRQKRLDSLQTSVKALRHSAGDVLVSSSVVSVHGGIIIAHSDGLKATGREDVSRPTLFDPGQIIVQEHKSGHRVDISIPVLSRSGHVIALARVGVNTQRINGLMKTTRWRAAGIGFLVLAVTSFVFWLIMGLFLRPIRDLSEDFKLLAVSGPVDSTSGTEIGMKTGLTSRDEIRQLSRTFSHISDKLQHAKREAVETERLEKELDAANRIQASLLPKRFPQINGYSIHALYRAAREVGGDYYDFIRVGHNKLGLVIGDVAGKGVPGAFVMAMVRSILRANSFHVNSPAEVLRSVNRQIFPDLQTGVFITLFYGILNAENNTFLYTSAGHDAAVLYNTYRRDIRRLKTKGIAIGLDGGGHFDKAIEEKEIQLQPGAALLAYTDGVTEAMNSSSEQYGESRLIKIMRSLHTSDMARIISEIDADVKKHVEVNPQQDDITMVGVGIL